MDTVNYEYVYLFLANADVQTGNEWTFYLQPQYYSNQRASKCAVSLADCNIDADVDDNILIQYTNGGFNFLSNEATSIAGGYLGKFEVSSGAKTNYYNFHLPEPIKILTAPRPNKITIRLYDSNTNPIDPLDITGGMIVLKYDYIPEKQALKEYFDAFYKTL